MSRETLLITVDDAEPVIVDTDGDVVAIALDDGKVVRLDRRELRAATDDRAAAA